MGYSDWQLNRIRDALRAFRQYTYVEDMNYYEHYDEKEKKKRSSLVKSFTWADVREAIAVSTGVEIGKDMKKGAERLRQFVEGTNDKKGPGGKRFPVPQDQWLDAIVTFVTSEDFALLSTDELNEYAPNIHAPLRLLEYLDKAVDSERYIPVEKIAGTFQATNSEREEVILRELTFQRPSESGLLQVIETEESCERQETSGVKPHGQRDALIKYGGWAILTPEDNLFVFLKHELTGNNRYYFTMASDLRSWSDTPLTHLFLLHHDFPFELEEDDTDETSVSTLLRASMSNNTVSFKRTI